MKLSSPESETRLRWRRFLVTLLTAAVVTAGCASSDPVPPSQTTGASATPRPAQPSPSATQISTPTPTIAPTAVPTATPVRPDAQPFPEPLRQLSLELLAQGSLLRDSPPIDNIDMFLLSREQARVFYSGGPNDSDSSQAPALDLKQEVYDLLGLVPKPEEFRGAELDNLISLLTGFYSPELGALYLLETINGGIDGPLARSTIVHELTHALQFQYYDIRSIVAARTGDWDAMTALLDVLEGDAVATEAALLGFSTRSTYREPVCFSIPAPQRPGTPFIVERELDTWYEDGLCFVELVLAQSPGGIAAIFDNLPTTTEQILHPEKYLVGEDAKTVTLQSLSASLGEDWQPLGQGTLGEFTLQNILLQGLADDRARAQAAAAGWGGDGWSFYSDGNARLLQITILWDSVAEARDFWDALVLSINNRAAGLISPAERDSFDIDLDGSSWRAAILADKITILVADDLVTLERAASTMGLP